MNTSKKVLVIDDEEDLRETVSYILKDKGFSVVTAVDGLDGLDKLKGMSPDLIILDMNMPRMNGLEFYQKIREREETASLPVLVLTARANMEQLFTDLDVDGFMAKPFELKELAEEAETIIKKNSGAVVKAVGSGEMRARQICIVDGDKDVFIPLATAFLETGYIVNAAPSGASAIKRMKMDPPDVAVVSMGLKDISGDVAILKLKGLEWAKRTRFLLYTAKTSDKARITKQISEKNGIDSFIEFQTIKEIVEAVDSLF